MNNYNSSEQEAYDRGFRAIDEKEAYNGRYFVRDGLIWIHNIDALMQKLSIHDEDELRDLDYDLDEYYKDGEAYQSLTPKQQRVKALGSKILENLGSKKRAIEVLVERYSFAYSTAKYAVS